MTVNPQIAQEFVPEIARWRMPDVVRRFANTAAWHVLGLRDLERLGRMAPDRPADASLFDELLRQLQIQVDVTESDLAKIPRSGPTIVVSNHPHGLLDGIALGSILSRIRGDVKFLANSLLSNVPELRGFLIDTEVQTGFVNSRAAVQAMRHLRGGGLLAVFPAGEVSHFRVGRGVRDGDWSSGVARLAAKAGPVQIVPAFIQGSNSLAFQAAGFLHAKARTLLLCRELIGKRNSAVDVRFGAPVASGKLAEFDTPEAGTDYLRWRSEILGQRTSNKSATRSKVTPIAPPVNPSHLEGDIESLPAQAELVRSQNFSVYLAESGQIPNVLTEIGRLREISFRAAGEGSGRALDLDRFDSTYLHLFLWNHSSREIIGAYRLAQTDKALAADGLKGLYTATLFRFKANFVQALGPALELGRSFIRPEYQKGFAPLLLLWKGIGGFLAANPRYRVLFGPVSISGNYSALSRELMVSWLEREETLEALRPMVAPRRRLRMRANFQRACVAGADELSSIVNDVDPGQRGVPVLLRHYLRLGGKLLSFSVDKSFSGVVDGLIVVDLNLTEPKLLDRYLGRTKAAA